MDSPQFGNLEKKLKAESDISQKIKLISNFWEGNGGIHSSRLEIIIKETLEDIKDSTNHFALGQGYLILGWLKYEQNLTEESLSFFAKAQEAFLQIDDQMALARAIIGKAAAFKQKGNYEKSFEEYLNALGVSDKIMDNEFKASILINIGALLSDLKQNSEAMEYFLSAKSIISPSSKNMIPLNYNLGKNFRLKGDLKKALDHIEKTINLIKSSDSKISKAETYLEMGIIYRLLGKNEEGYAIQNQALSFTNGLSNKRIRGQVLLELGIIKNSLEEYQEALVFLSEALNIFCDLGLKDYEVQVLNIMFDIYGTLGDYANAFLISNKYQSIGNQNYDTELTNRLGVMKAQQLRKENLIYQDLYDRISTISEIGQAISSTSNTKEIGSIIYSNLKKLMEIDNLYACLYLEEENSLSFKIFMKNEELFPEFIAPIKNKNFIYNRYYTSQKGFLINDLSNHNEPLLKDFLEFNIPIDRNINSLLCAPLVARGKILGWLTVESLKADAYLAYHLDLLNVVASYTAIALENESLISNVNELATIDLVTGLFNKKQILEQAEDEFIRFKRYNDPFSLILIDIDNFKGINDAYGHATADLLLEHVAKIFSIVIRATDVLGRIGGDEFFLLLPSTDIEGAKILAIRLQEAVFKHEYNIENQIINVKASMGLSQVHEADNNFNELLDRANEALKEAKSDGGATYKVVHIDY